MSNPQISAPNLFSIIDELERDRKKIASLWIKIPRVKSVFRARKISDEKFRDGYGIPIIEYFISVVRKEKEIGNCPIMSKLVNYFLEKDITPKEVFDICMGLRRAVVLFLFKQDKVLKNPYPFMDELAIISDANLSGVLDIFTNYYAESQKKVHSEKIQKEKLEQTSKIINFINPKLFIVQNDRIILANKPFLEMLGVDDLNGLYQKYENGFGFINGIDVYENDYRVNIARWIRMVCSSNKAFKCEIYNEKYKKTFSYSGRITDMPEEDSQQYIVTLSNISQHIRQEEEIIDSLTHDEMTGFRNYPTFEKLISKKIEEVKADGSRIFLAIVDIPDLREINDKKGRDQGDMVIAEVAENLRSLVNHNIYLSRLEGSRFGILIKYQSEQATYDWCVKLSKLMNEKEERKTLAVTEIDLSESINKLFLRAYDLIETSNNNGDEILVTDFKYVIEHKEIPDQKEFTQRLSNITSINMTLFYFELPISSNVKISSILQDSVDVALSSKQIKIAQKGMPIYFKLNKIGNTKAFVKEVYKNRGVVTINNFRFDKHSPLDRNTCRIKLKDDIKAYISEGDREFDVKILDMSDEYIAIEIDRKRNFDINSLVYLDMMLPISEAMHSCSTKNAVITRIEKSPNGYKMVLLCDFDSTNKEMIRKYILKYQLDLIQDFKE